ncbi:MAG TPA: enoyl-CoA hydratase/isomerase family protein [Phycisphaerae bacterium]|nr:enoyl-CoA hydratase/isomerase family protein [Phycisphaerales bacterium]HRX83914.1 enoyl-CoA hydratase/isomerase family protein [Phycisphaerae bacterium]
MPEFVHHAIYKGIATVSLNRPDLHNAFNDAMIAELAAEVRTVQADANVRVVVLAGEGRSFCAGADLAWMQRMVNYTQAENVADAQALADMLRVIRDCPKPTIARVHGPVYGGGVGLVAACDMAVALKKVTFCLSEVKLGIAPAVIAPFLAERIGAGPLRRWALTAEAFEAATALRMGLIHEVVDQPEELDAWIREIAEAVRKTGPNAVSACKRILHEVAHQSFDDAVAGCVQRIAELRTGKEGQEGLKAFLEKRKPKWAE